MNDQVQFPLLKLATAWVITIFGSWGEAAAFLAAVYSLVLIGEWMFKKSISVYAWMKARNEDGQ